MTTDSLPKSYPDDPVKLLGTSSLKRDGRTRTRYIASALAAKGTETIVLISFDSSQYPLEEHCCYAVHRDENAPYTFPNFDFRSQPPGIRVGPWPGWRGIPLMPSATLKAGETNRELQFQFWGDELDRHVLRAVARFHSLSSEQISLDTADERLVPLEAQFYAVRPLKPEPFVFDIAAEKLHLHPRLLINETDLPALRQKTAAQEGLLRRIHDFIPRWNQTLVVTPESKLPDTAESLTPEDRVLIGAFLALIEPTPANTERGIRSILNYCNLTEEPGFAPLTIDTQSGETLFLLCVGYDWLFPYLNSEQEQRLRKRLWEVADICWNHLGYEREDYAQAHYLGCGLGLLAFSLLFPDTHPRAREWSSHLAGVLKLVLSVLPADGYFPHGINLWIYEFGFLLRWLELLRNSGGPDLWPQSPALNNAFMFRAAATSPDGLSGVTFGDPQYRVGGDSWCHYLIAARTGSGEARWLADYLLNQPVAGVDFRHAPARRRVYEYLWFPDRVEPVRPRNGIIVFRDGAQLFVRTHDFLFTFRSGPPLGNHRFKAGITGGYGHSDPCNGSFLLCRNDAMVIVGPGPVYRRDTSLQNIITIGGKGQIGDSAVWMPDFIPPSLHAPSAEIKSTGNSVAATVDLTHAYLPHLGVRMLRRSVLVDSGNIVLGADIVALATEASIEWNLHSFEGFTQLEGGTILRFTIGAGSNRPTVLVSFSTDNVTWKTGFSDSVPAYPNSGQRDKFLQAACFTEKTVIHWCICLTDSLPDLQHRKGNNAVWIFPNGTAAEFDGTRISMRGTP
ncbi:MAG: hypothetical protein WEB37_11045 [Bacteroidota bacterium]